MINAIYEKLNEALFKPASEDEINQRTEEIRADARKIAEWLIHSDIEGSEVPFFRIEQKHMELRDLVTALDNIGLFTHEQLRAKYEMPFDRGYNLPKWVLKNV